MSVLHKKPVSGIDNVEWEFHRAKDFGRFMVEWDEINCVASGLPLLSAVFVELLLKEYGTGRELIAVGRRGSKAHAMAILKRERYGFYATFQPAQAPLGAWIHRPADTLESLAPSLLRNIPGFALALGISQQDPDLVFRPAESETTQTLDYIQTARVTISGTFDEYWAARGKNLRNNTKRQRSRLEKDGVALHLETIFDPANVAQAIADYGTLESAGWKGSEGTAIHPDNAQGRFYRALLEDCCHLGRGRIYRYWYGESVSAVDLCVESGDTLIVLKTTYDETIKTSSPASLMRHEYFEKIFAEGKIKRIEFYGKVMDWHTRWTDEVRTMYHVNYYRWPLIPKLRRFIRQFRKTCVPGSQNPQGSLANHASKHVEVSRQSHAVSVCDDLSALGRRCETLFTRAGETSLFLTWPWYENYAKTVLGSDARLRAYTVEMAAHQGNPCAVLLMQHSETSARRLRTRSLNSLGNYYTSLIGPILDPAEPEVQTVLNLLAAKIAFDEFRWDTVDLHPLEMDSPVFHALVGAFRHAGYLVHTYFCFGNWYLQVSGRSFADYFQSLPSRVKNTVRKKREQVKESIGSNILVYKDLENLDEAVSAYERIYAASWKSPEPYPGFIHGLCHTCALLGWLRLGVMYVNKQPAAAQIWIVHAKVATIYKLAHDEQFSTFSPGTLLTAHLMEYVIDVDKVSEVDYLTGDEPYKKGWMSHRRERWGIVAFNPRTPLGLLALSAHLLGRARRRTHEFIAQLRLVSNRAL